jgi:hypothetical protein
VTTDLDRQDWIDGAKSAVLAAVKDHATWHDAKTGDCHICDAWWIYADLTIGAGSRYRAQRLAWLL